MPTLSPPLFPRDVRVGLRALLSRHARSGVFVLVDEHTECHCLPLVRTAFDRVGAKVLRVAAGDEHKTIDTAIALWHQLVREGATRHSLLVNLGGGMVCDLGAFVAATFKRGMTAVNIPTTLLAMVDAAWGGKNGVNFEGLKNEIGTFVAPVATLVHPQWLATLPAGELLSGYGEMLKHGLLADVHHWADVLKLDPLTLAVHPRAGEVLARSLQVKTDIVLSDPLEHDRRQVLNLGHTIGHALEALLQQRGTPMVMPHGNAVAHGLVAALYLSSALRGFPTDKMRQTVAHIRILYGRPPISCDDYAALYALAQHDKKNTDGIPAFVLLDDIGQPQTGIPIDRRHFDETLDFLREG